MMATEATRRARVQSGAAVTFSGRAMHHYWPLFAAYFRGVLLVPHGRAESDLVTWEWQEMPGSEPPSRSELQTLRKRLAADRATFLDSVESIAEDPARRASVNVAALAHALDEVVTGLLHREDAELARCVCRTAAGLRLHGWGLTESPVVTYPDEHDVADAIALPRGLAAEPRPARRRRGGVVWVAIGILALVCGAVWFGRTTSVSREVPRSEAAGDLISESSALERGLASRAETLPTKRPENPATIARAGGPPSADGNATTPPAQRDTGRRDQVGLDTSLGSKRVELEENALVVPGSPMGAALPTAAGRKMSGAIDGVPAGRAGGSPGAGGNEETYLDPNVLSSGSREPGTPKPDPGGEPLGERNVAATVIVRPGLKAGATIEATERDLRGNRGNESAETEPASKRAELAAEFAVDAAEFPLGSLQNAADETNRRGLGAERPVLEHFELGNIVRRLVRVDDVIVPTLPVRRGAKSSIPVSDWAAALWRPPDALAAADVELTAVFALPDALEGATADWQGSGPRARSISADGRSAEVKWPLPAERASARFRARLVRRNVGESGAIGASREILALEQDGSGRLSIAMPPRTRMRLRITVQLPIGGSSGSETLRWEDASGGPPPAAVQVTAATAEQFCSAEWEITSVNAGAQWTLRLRDANSGWAWIFTGGAESRP